MSPEVNDIEQLRSFQTALSPPQAPGCSFATLDAGFAAASGSVGGDFHDHLELDGSHQVALVGDVTGHGLSSALVMAVTFGALREAFRSMQLPCAVMNGLHALLAELGDRAGGPRLFSATLFLGVLASDGEFKFVNAGHPPGLVLRAEGGVERLDASIPPLGFAEPTRCQSVASALRPGDRLVLYSDGILKQDERMAELIERIDAHRELEGPAFVEALLAEGAADDRTALVLHFSGGACPEA